MPKSDNEIRIYGASDDLIEFEGAFNEEFNSEDATFLVAGVLRVRVFYGQAGCWNISVGMLDEDLEIPDMKLGKRSDTAYSVELVVSLCKADGSRFPASVIRVHEESE